MILGGKLPGKVGRCRFLFCKIFLQYRGKIAVMLSFFLLATSLLSERMVSFDPLCSVAALARWVVSRRAVAKTETRRVSCQEVQRFSAWHFKGRAIRRRRKRVRSHVRNAALQCVVFYGGCKKENHETCRAAPARYMDVAGFLLPWFTHNRDKKLRTCAPFFLPKLR